MGHWPHRGLIIRFNREHCALSAPTPQRLSVVRESSRFGSRARQAMAPREAQEGPKPTPTPPSTLPGLWKYPSHRLRQAEEPVTGDMYLDSRREDDGAEGLWRVHDKLYDLTTFVDKHPGGAHWLRRTKGMDVTEAFESHHIVIERAARVLAKYEVRDAAERRNSPYTFHDDGFYRTLKRRAVDVLAVTPDPGFSPRFNDALVTASFLAVVAAARCGCFALATVAALIISFATVCAHNFTHRKDNWRMYYKSLGFMSLTYVLRKIPALRSNGCRTSASAIPFPPYLFYL